MDITKLSKSTSIEDICSKIQETIIKTQLAHWAIKPSTNYALHIALGEFYEGLYSFIDTFVESAQGTYNKVFTLNIPACTTIQNTNTIDSVIMGFKEYIESARNNVPHSHLQNQLDEILTLTNHTLYKIK